MSSPWNHGELALSGEQRRKPAADVAGDQHGLIAVIDADVHLARAHLLLVDELAVFGGHPLVALVGEDAAPAAPGAGHGARCHHGEPDVRGGRREFPAPGRAGRVSAMPGRCGRRSRFRRACVATPARRRPRRCAAAAGRPGPARPCRDRRCGTPLPRRSCRLRSSRFSHPDFVPDQTIPKPEL